MTKGEIDLLVQYRTVLLSRRAITSFGCSKNQSHPTFTYSVAFFCLIFGRGETNVLKMIRLCSHHRLNTYIGTYVLICVHIFRSYQEVNDSSELPYVLRKYFSRMSVYTYVLTYVGTVLFAGKNFCYEDLFTKQHVCTSTVPYYYYNQ